MTKLSDYLLDSRYEGVEGWLMDGAAWITFLLARFQDDHGITGDVAEIGVHHGKFFNLLSLLSSDDEKAIAIDVFEQQELNVDQSGSGNYGQFTENFARFDGRPGKLIIHGMDSLQLHGRDITDADCPVSASPPKTVRLFSVDGCHTAQHTVSDIRAAFDVLRRGGVVIVDDFYNHYWPGVQEGVHAALAKYPDICGIAYGENKLFLVTNDDYDLYAEFFLEHNQFYRETKQVELHGKPALLFGMSNPRNHFDQTLERRRWIASFGNSDLVELVEGWAMPETSGAWTTGARAVAKVKLPTALCQERKPVSLSLDVSPFTYPDRPDRLVEIETNGAGTFRSRMSGTETVSLTIPDPMATRELILTISGDPPEIPADCIPNDKDQRPLAIFASTLSLEIAR